MCSAEFVTHCVLACIHSNLVNSKSSGLEVLFLIISSSNYREVDIKIYISKNNHYQTFYLSNISFGRVKETSQGDVSFTHPKYMIL